MGLTDHNAKALADLIPRYQIKSVCELGAQNIYASEKWNGQWASQWYWELGISRYQCIDINGANNARALDLSRKQKFKEQFDLVTDFGTSEHVKNHYICWLNKYNLCKTGGLIYSENPKTGNWPGHALHYLDENFYPQLAKLTSMTLIAHGQHPAMQNTTDGWNIWGLLRKEATASFNFKDQYATLGVKKT